MSLGFFPAAVDAEDVALVRLFAQSPKRYVQRLGATEVMFFIEGNLVGMASRQARIGVGHAIDQ